MTSAPIIIDVHQHEALDHICQAIRCILNASSINSFNWTANYGLYWCMSSDDPASIWPKFRDLMFERTRQRVECLAAQEQIDPERFLQQVHLEWLDHVRALKALGELFAYLDTTVIARSEVRSIESAGHAMLGEALRASKVWTFLVNSFLYSLQQFREGKVTESRAEELITSLSQLFMHIDTGDMLLDRVQAEMDTYYKTIGQQPHTIEQLLDQNVNALRIESKIATELLGLQSATKFHLIVINRLFYDLILTAEPILAVESALLRLCERGGPYLKAFGLLTLAAPTEGILTAVANAFSKVILHQGRSIMRRRVSDEQFLSLLDDPTTSSTGEEGLTEMTSLMILPIVRSIDNCEAFIEDLLTLHKSHTDIVTTVFQNHAIFQECHKSAWRLLVSNHTFIGGVIAVVLAQYVDKLFRTHARAPDANWTEILNPPYSLFTHIQCKDFFIEFYRKDLVTRLLTGRGPRSETELEFVKRMKEDCGACFTDKIERTFSELKSSREEWKNFVTSTDLNKLSPINFQIHCLHDSVWPLRLVMEQEEGTARGGSRLAGVIWPQECLRIQGAFETFFKERHPMRHLNWEWSVGSFTLSGVFNGRKYQLVCSPPQALCLLLFNDKATLTVKQVETLLNLPERTIESALLSLSTDPDRMVLIREYVKDRPIYKVNESFNPSSNKVVLPQLSLRETQERLTRVDAAVASDRSYYVDALAVRTLKKAQSMKEQELIQTIVSDGRFTVTWQFVVDRLEALVERAYIKRTGDNFVYNDN